ncbi:MAG: DUF3750 domain-containing protein, partial [Paraglaciecola chathamensis]
MKVLAIIALVILLGACSNKDWRTASRESAGLALNPVTDTQASIEVYAADAFSWRGWFAVHTWLAVKQENDPEYTVYEVVGWRVNSGLP